MTDDIKNLAELLDHHIDAKFERFREEMLAEIRSATAVYIPTVTHSSVSPGNGGFLTTSAVTTTASAPRKRRQKRTVQLTLEQKRAENAAYQRAYRARKAAEKAGLPWPPPETQAVVKIEPTSSVPRQKPVNGVDSHGKAGRASSGLHQTNGAQAAIEYVTEVSLDV